MKKANEMSPRRHSTSSGSIRIQVNEDWTQLNKKFGCLQRKSDGFRRSRHKDAIHCHGSSSTPYQQKILLPLRTSL
ncbi:hypothetical protein GCK72_001539 [Caenorhabditis remanei]|uniref:Uncharacterized protein n=1 Tax=Caenorhabditis remanei TaxID=31234 RepID=A0A6A5HVE2_CAERE|nr:hypothetical protein GCK72_001539 [Caenorhabditis remanei]KAF1769722.1 hypothetical protein GCK72_001539 [Caenorhabditis remanei]